MINAGYKASETSEETDIIIINTCGFIKPAKEESIDVILDSADLNENVRTVVTGCLSQRYFNEIYKDMPEIDFLYGLPDDNFVKELKANGGCISADYRASLARSAFSRTALYDAVIADYLNKKSGVLFPESFTLPLKKKKPANQELPAVAEKIKINHAVLVCLAKDS